MTDTPKPAPAKTLRCFGCGKPIVFQSNGVWGHASSSDALECPMGVTQPTPATPSATPLREANQQRVDAAAQRVRQAMDYRKYLPGDPFRKDVELLIEIALAPVLEIFAVAAQPAATPMDLVAKWRAEAQRGREKASKVAKSSDLPVQVLTEYDTAMERCANELEAALQPAAAQPQRDSEPRQCSCPIEQCDGPKSANEYCTAHPPKQFERESEQQEQAALREALDGWMEAHQRLDHSGITDCTRCKRIAEIQSGFKLAALSPQTDSQEPR